MNMHAQIAIAVALTFPLALVGCEREPDASQKDVVYKQSPNDRTTPQDEVYGTPREGDQVTDHYEQLKKNIAEWREEMAAESKELSSEVQARWENWQVTLDAKAERAEVKLAEFRAASKENWEEAKAGLKSAADDLEDAYEAAKAELRNDEPAEPIQP